MARVHTLSYQATTKLGLLTIAGFKGTSLVYYCPQEVEDCPAVFVNPQDVSSSLNERERYERVINIPSCDHGQMVPDALFDH